MWSQIIWGIGLVLLIIVIINRFKQKENEDFKERNN
jgi:hypothetical protein